LGSDLQELIGVPNLKGDMSRNVPVHVAVVSGTGQTARVMAVDGLVASTVSLLGSLSAGLANRLSVRIASRIEIRLLRALRLGS